jgi:hypothetical protein
MMSNQPPPIATWMLKHFGCGPDNDAVLGDLAEQYLRKDSALWYWRQAMNAIPVSLFREVRKHKLIAGRALLTGWILWILCGVLIAPLAEPFFFGPWRAMFNPVLGGGIMPVPLSDSYAGYRYLYLFLYPIALPLMVGTVSGWLIARFHRSQQTTAVLLFASSLLLVNLMMFGPGLVLGLPFPFAARLLANVVTSVLGILIGGGLLRDSKAVGN